MKRTQSAQRRCGAELRREPLRIPALTAGAANQPLRAPKGEEWHCSGQEIEILLAPSAPSL